MNRSTLFKHLLLPLMAATGLALSACADDPILEAPVKKPAGGSYGNPNPGADTTKKISPLHPVFNPSRF